MKKQKIEQESEARFWAMAIIAFIGTVGGFIFLGSLIFGEHKEIEEDRIKGIENQLYLLDEKIEDLKEDLAKKECEEKGGKFNDFSSRVIRIYCQKNNKLYEWNGVEWIRKNVEVLK